ncbi:hypothetical protein HHK36_006063 [Tetracentron sinense]|uniref:Uncharacterized protein n=1 Tax=Tetracentron sinense TaxID=13715 RepID=A0A834ZR67_TETSI|nr:hypothetical protein HHK36_006063 [Tetracentron sinense]
MSGRNAKTNFPAVKTPMDDTKIGEDSPSSPMGLSASLSAKLRRSCKAPSPSLTCLRLDTENSHIGVWQKGAGAQSDSGWVMKVELGKKSEQASTAGLPLLKSSAAVAAPEIGDGIDEEQRVALQMIEELLNRNCSSPSPSDGDGTSHGR